MLSEVSHTEKDKYCMVSFACGIQKSQTHGYREQNGDYQGLKGEENREMLVKGANFWF